MGTARASASLALEAFREWIRDRCEGFAAGLAFHALLGFGSLYAAILFASAKVLGEDWTRHYVGPVFRAWVGPRGEAALRSVLAGHEHVDASTLLTLGVAGVVSLLVGASGYFLQMQDALEFVWGVRREDASVVKQLKKRARGLGYATGSALILLAGFVAAGAVMSALDEPDTGRITGAALAAEVAVGFLAVWAVTTFWLTRLPPVRLSLRQVLPWTASIAGLTMAGRLALSWLVRDRADAVSVDAAEAIVLVLLWFLYSSMAFLYCAELMRLHLERSGSPVRPRERGGVRGAVRGVLHEAASSVPRSTEL